jgi:hypothetical protein
MKVKFKYGIRTYSGKVDEMVYGSYRHNRLCIGRVYVYPRLTENNKKIGKIGKNLALIWDAADNDYRDDFKLYALRHGIEHVPGDKLPPNAYSIWIKMMWEWAKTEENIELASITDEDFSVSNGKCSSVKACVDNGFLPKVLGYKEMTGTW